MTDTFTRSDGRSLKLVRGLRERILGRPSTNPKARWTDADYRAGARTKLKRWQRGLSRLDKLGIELDAARVLDVGCGNGIDCLLMGLQPVRQVVGIDIRQSLFSKKKGRRKRNRRLAGEVLKLVGEEPDPSSVLCRLPVHLLEGDATNMPFVDESFDLILSKSFLEHLVPIEDGLSEMERVLAPGGHMYHVIDPFYWLRGCHAAALVDIPWAHARLPLADYERFVAADEGEEAARKRCDSLRSLNHFTPARYREVFDSRPLEIVRWEAKPSELAQVVLAEHPEVVETLVEEISRDDLLCSQVRVLACKR